MVRIGGGLGGSLCNESSKISCVVRGFGIVGWSCDGGGEDAWMEGEDTVREGGGEQEQEEEEEGCVEKLALAAHFC